MPEAIELASSGSQDLGLIALQMSENQVLLVYL